MVWYVDSSAFLKLFVTEDHSAAMREWFEAHSPIWSSQLLRTESLRAAARLGVAAEDVEDVLSDVSLVLPSVATFASAASLAPVSLRALDALHLASALELGADLEALVAYDDRLIEGAKAASVKVLSPE